MKNYWFLALFGLAVAAFGQQAGEIELACDCPSCREKAASGKEFTLPGLQGLEDGNMEQAALPEHDPAEEGYDQDSDEGHDHDSTTGHQHDASEVCCPHDEARVPEAGPHDHDSDGVSHHAPHDEQEGDGQDDHKGHDHGNHADGGIELSADMIQKMGIQVHEADSGPIAKSSVFPAEIKLNRDRMAGVSPRYDSMVRQVFVEIGDDVRKGDILASLENRETMAVYSVSAPLDGTVISKELSVGETVETGQVLYEVANLDTVWADISIFPQYQHLIKRGMAVEFVAHDGHSKKAMVKYISPLVSHETRTFTARCVLQEAGVDFTPGAFVRARIDTEEVDAAVRIEREAVQTVNGITVVFVPGDHGYESVDVEVGLSNEHFVEIKRGLNPGDQYVAGGAFSLKAELITSGMDPHAGHNH